MDVWNDPVNTETQGVQANDPPATPSEVVEKPAADAGALKTEETPVEKKADEEKPSEQAQEKAAPEAQSDQPSDDSPDVKREGRRLFFKVKELGGEHVVDDALALQTAIQDPTLSAQAKLQKLYQAAPRAYEEIRRDMFFAELDKPGQKDAVAEDIFGAGWTVEKITQLITGANAPSPTAELPEELPEEETLSPATKARLARLEELEKEFPQLKSQVSSINEERERLHVEKVNALGGEFLQEAMQPVVRMMKEAGLEVLPDDPPEEKAWKEHTWRTVMRDVHEELTMSAANKPLADDIEMFLTKLDRASAWSKMRQAQARAEMAASKVLPVVTSYRQKQRESQTSGLNKDRPTLIPGGQSTFGTKQPLPTGRDVWDDGNEQERWKDIASSVA